MDHLPDKTECIFATCLLHKHIIGLHLTGKVCVHFGSLVVVHELSDLLVELAVFVAPLEHCLDLGQGQVVVEPGAVVDEVSVEFVGGWGLRVVSAASTGVGVGNGVGGLRVYVGGKLVVLVLEDGVFVEVAV